jgi:hypothetical protein
VSSVTTFNYDSALDYTFDSSKIEFSSGSARLVNQFTAHQTANPAIIFASSFNLGNGNAHYGNGTLTVTETGSPTYTSGQANLDGGGTQYHE